MTKVFDENPLNVLKQCGGCYESPRDKNGKIIGPLVAYAGKYKDNAGNEKQYVGPDYFNFARAEQHPDICNYFARAIMQDMWEKMPGDPMPNPDVVIGMPMGGIILSTHLGILLDCRVVFAEKKITALADPENGLKEISELIINRHEIYPGDHVAIVEDVCNNFSTTEKAAQLIAGVDAKFFGILCGINRSKTEKWNDYNVISSIFKPSEQYKQEDPAVADLISRGKIVWKPKQQWEVLKAAMKK
jgi:adenine/guanine phosphoribosyltransferase-like PRPP-binding protein